MVEISLSGSGEGLGRVIARGYSTSGKNLVSARILLHGLAFNLRPLALAFAFPQEVLKDMQHLEARPSSVLNLLLVGTQGRRAIGMRPTAARG